MRLGCGWGAGGGEANNPFCTRNEHTDLVVIEAQLNEGFQCGETGDCFYAAVAEDNSVRLGKLQVSGSWREHSRSEARC